MIWNWGKAALGLVQLAQWAANKAEREQTLDQGIRLQIADSLTSFVRRIDIGLKISREVRTVDDALGELRRGADSASGGTS